MNCNDAIERLPWFLNGTLDPEERRQVLEHVTGCPACKAALADTREAWHLFAQHIPAVDLVAYAAGETAEGTDRELLEEHLASCPPCAAELELVRTSRGLAEDDGVALFMPRVQSEAGPAARPVTAAPAGNLRRWRSSALAAALAGVAFLGLWLHSVGEMSSLQSRFAAEQQARVQAEREASTRVQATPAQAPGAGPERPEDPNLRIIQLQPLDERTRSGGDEEMDQVAVGPDRLVLYLPYVPERHKDSTETSFEVDLLSQGALVHAFPDIKLRESGEYTFEVPLSFLQAGKTYDVQVYARKDGRREPRESYRFQAVASGAAAPRQ